MKFAHYFAIIFVLIVATSMAACSRLTNVAAKAVDAPTQQQYDEAETPEEVEALDVKTKQAISNAGEKVRAIGDIAGVLGVPAASVAADKFAGLLEYGLMAILGSGALGGGLLAKKRKRDRDGLAEVIAVNEDVGMIVEDKAKRNDAKNRLSANAIRSLAIAKAQAKSRHTFK